MKVDLRIVSALYSLLLLSGITGISGCSMSRYPTDGMGGAGQAGSNASSGGEKSSSPAGGSGGQAAGGGTNNRRAASSTGAAPALPPTCDSNVASNAGVDAGAPLRVVGAWVVVAVTLQGLFVG